MDHVITTAAIVALSMWTAILNIRIMSLVREVEALSAHVDKRLG